MLADHFASLAKQVGEVVLVLGLRGLGFRGLGFRG